MDTSIQKVRNELMALTRKEQFEIEISKLEVEKTDMKLIIEKLRNEKETTKKNVTEEKEVLKTKIIELKAKENAQLTKLKENECLKTEKERLEAKAKKKPNSDVALVVLHSKEIKRPSEKMLTEPEYRKLGIIVDISFLSAKGIISNDVTDKAIHQLVGFLNNYLTRQENREHMKLLMFFRHLESSVVTLKGEREFFKKQLKKLETQTYSSHSSNDRRVMYYEADTQTETDEEVNKSILIDTLRSRNEELEKENIKLNEKIKQKEPAPAIRGKYYTDKPRKKDHEETKNKIEELDSRCRTLQEQLEKSVIDVDKIKQENEELQKKSKKDEEIITLFKNDLREKHNKIHEQENRAQELNRQLEQGKTLKCELSLYKVNFQNEKIKTKELENKVLQLEEQISDLKLRNKKLETDLEINETTATQEKANLQNKLVEQSKDYGKMCYE
ncbi:unnamed protein product [Mytilus edulis]|uniref:Uncharacterized protein n=1 Tax=Mytilus edulis TaxID=6550 RepID=A0A8S3VEX7_MYTED|nr:unnamed protein product [Mytilus edulis]